MDKKKLTTSIGEVNLLYGHYVDMIHQGRAHDAANAWAAYERYVKKYKQERGLRLAMIRRRGTFEE